MKTILLAAGYATRLYPLTLNCPKPLLDVAGRVMLDHILEVLSPIREIDEYIVVTNSKFAEHFRQWASRKTMKVTIVDDLTTDDSNKRGAVGDIYYVMEQLKIEDDLLVLAGDNLFEKPLNNFWKRCQQSHQPTVGIYDVGDLELVKKYSSVHVDDRGQVTDFVEKPKDPKSTFSAIALYYYPKSVLPLIRQYVTDGNNPDQPGRLVAWMYTRTPVFTYRIEGLWFDIGSKESLVEADRIFKSFQK